MIARLLQFLFALFFLRLVWGLIASLLKGASRPEGETGGAGGSLRSGGRMVRDPECGTFLLPARAITAKVDGELQHFCSEDCRRSFDLKRERAS